MAFTVKLPALDFPEAVDERVAFLDGLVLEIRDKSGALIVTAPLGQLELVGGAR